MENEQLKVSTKTRGLNFMEMCSACSVCTAQVNDAGGDWWNRRGVFCRGGKLQSHYWSGNQSLETGGGAVQRASSAR